MAVTRPIPEEFQDPRWAHQSVKPELLGRFLSDEDIAGGDYLSKNHVRDGETRATLLSHEHVRVLNITRDLRDVLVSAYHHDRREGRAESDIGDYWRGLGRRRIAQVVEHHRIWNTGHSQVFVASYEALQVSFDAQVRALAAFLEVEKVDVEMIRAKTEFRQLRRKSKTVTEEPFHRKGIVGDWRNHLSDDILAELAQASGSVKSFGAENVGATSGRRAGGPRRSVAGADVRRPSPQRKPEEKPGRGDQTKASAGHRNQGRRQAGKAGGAQKRRFAAVAVHQMGKVGSKSVHDAISDLDLWPCFHTHVLNRSAQLLQADSSARPKGRKEDAAHVLSARKLRSEYLERGRPVAIITPVREPIGRNVSAFFQRLDSVLVDTSVRRDDPRELYELFKEQFHHTRPQSWFEEELNEPFGVDVFAQPFPAAGSVVLKSPPHRILVLKSFLPDERKAAILRRFLGVSALTVPRAHLTRDTRDVQVYEQFKKLIGQDREYIDGLLAMPMAQHFFSEQERGATREEWLEIGRA